MDKETLVLKEVTFRAMVGMIAVMVGDAVGAEVGLLTVIILKSFTVMVVVVTLLKSVDDCWMDLRNDPVPVAVCSSAVRVSYALLTLIAPSLFSATETFHTTEVPATRDLDTWSVSGILDPTSDVSTTLCSFSPLLVFTGDEDIIITSIVRTPSIELAIAVRKDNRPSSVAITTLSKPGMKTTELKVSAE
jgi:hypothetical protein